MLPAPPAAVADVENPDWSLSPVTLRHFPLLRAAIERLGIRGVIDELLPKDPRSVVSDADCVTLMVANILSGRVALYGMGEWLAGTDVGLLLGEGCPPESFTDDRLGKCLDHLYRVGTDTVFAGVARSFLASSPPAPSVLVPTDTTSITLQGAYATPSTHAGAPVPARGHSKDFRPDLKQLIYGLSLHGPTGVPLCASMLDGNTADAVANRIQIDKLAQTLPPETDVTLIADCKLVDALTLGWARRSGFHYVSLLPRTFALRDALVEEVRTSGVAMEEVGRYPGRLKADPPRVYRAVGFDRELPITDADTGVVTQVPHRLVVLSSSSLAEAFEAALPERVEKDARLLTAAFDRLGRQQFACEDDAWAALLPVLGRAEWHTAEARVVADKERVKRARPGRPAAGECAEYSHFWRVELAALTRDEERIARDRFHASHFVLVSSRVGDPTWPDGRVLETYRSQQTIEGHAGFRWLKGAAAVAPVFLKEEHRIAALGLVFLLALMVRNWVEGTIRGELATRGEKLPDMNDRPIARPSAEAIFRLFDLVQGIQVHQGERLVGRKVFRLSCAAERVLELLGFSRAIYTGASAELEIRRGG